mgnify:CR=1 FL=1
MPKSRSEQKTEIIATRVTPMIKSIILREARREGLGVSEWIRNVIISELKSRNALPKVFDIPKMEDVQNE